MKSILCIISMLALLATGGQAIAYSIALNPVAQTIFQTDTAVVNVDLALTGSEALYGFDLALSFNSAVLGFSSGFSTDLMSLVNPLDPQFNYVGGFTASPGSIAFNGFNVVSPLTGEITLASLSFAGINPGSSLLGLDGFLDLGTLDTSGGNVLDPASASARVDVASAPAPVPEPATLLLLGSGLAGLFGFRRKLQEV